MPSSAFLCLQASSGTPTRPTHARAHDPMPPPKGPSTARLCQSLGGECFVILSHVWDWGWARLFARVALEVTRMRLA